MRKNSIYDALKKHVSHKDDIEIILLKGHLILEQAINMLLGIYISNEEELNSLRLMFTKKIDLLVALQGKREFLDEAISQLKEINRIRNKLAHQLDFNDYHEDLHKWACSVVGNAPATINRKSAYRNTLIKAFYIMATKLDGYAAGFKAGKEDL